MFLAPSIPSRNMIFLAILNG
uniref:Uncharacterized protein n=1 Tax=Arundo donax TaxID=35708 RepID=A0A0A9HVW5_ARUDO